MFGKKALSIFLSLAMSITMVPAMSFAGENDAAGEPSQEAEVKLQADPGQDELYLLMNIPYAYFYEEEFHGNKNENEGSEIESAAVFDPATQGNYHEPSYEKAAEAVAEGQTPKGSFKGVTFPVKTTRENLDKLLESSLGKNAAWIDPSNEESVEKYTVTIPDKDGNDVEYAGKEALFDLPTYSCYVLSGEPSVYKELKEVNGGVPTFGKAEGSNVDSSAGSLDGEVSYYTENGNDVEVTFSGSDFTVQDTDKVKAIWLRSETSNSHHHCFGLLKGANIVDSTTIGYEALETGGGGIDIKDGDRIVDVVYYYEDEEGNEFVKKYSADIEVLKVVHDWKLNVPDIDLPNSQTLANLNQELPSKFEAEGILLKDGVAVDEGDYIAEFKSKTKVQLSISSSKFEPGTYTLKIHDTSGTYGDITADFLIKAADTGSCPAKYNESAKYPALENADIPEMADQYEEFVKNITTVTVDGEAYAADKIKIIDEDGKIHLDAKDGEKPIFTLGEVYSMKVESNGFERPLSFIMDLSYDYVLMNVPYADFYQNVGVNLVNTAEQVTSETEDAWSLVDTGSYYVSKESETAETGKPAGAIFPVRALPEDLKELLEANPDAVKVVDKSEEKTVETAAEGGRTEKTTISGKDLLVDSPSYSYYDLEDKEPAIYRTFRFDEGGVIFSTIEGKESELLTNGDVETALETSTHNGNDFEITVSGVDEVDNALEKGAKIAGVLVYTANETYGIVHVVNLQDGLKIVGDQTQLPLGGKTITGITFITTEGAFFYNADLYVPLVAGSETGDDITFTVEAGLVDGTDHPATTSGEFSKALPTDYDAEVVIEGVDGNVDVVIGTNGVATVTYLGNLLPGVYTLTVKDKEKYYADIVTTVELYSETIPVKYNEIPAEPALVAAEDVTDDYFKNYIKNITKVTVDGTEYAAVGDGAVRIIDAEGNIDLEVKDTDDENIFAAGNKYEITVTADGFKNDYTFELDLTENYQYVLMNIPYADFYKAEGAAFTAADAEWADAAAGSYYEVAEDGTQVVTGVIFPVKVSERDLGTFLDGKEDAELVEAEDADAAKALLAEKASYSYYVLGTDVTPVFKLLSFDDEGKAAFGAVDGEGIVPESSGTLESEAEYKVDGYDFKVALSAAEGTTFDFTAESVVSAIIIETDHGKTFGLLHVTNIADAITIVGDDDQLPIDGQTITSITYITTDGVYVYDAYIPVEGIADSELTESDLEVNIEDGELADGKTKGTISAAPSTCSPLFNAEYSIDELADAAIKVALTKIDITYSTDAIPGPYTIVVHDHGNYYADVTGDFVVWTYDEPPAKYNKSIKNPALVKTETADQVHFDAYLKNINAVTVKLADDEGEGTTYEGEDAAKIILEDGTIVIDGDAKDEEITGEEEGESTEDPAPVFERGNIYEVTVSSIGYHNDLTFTLDLRTFVLMNIPYEGFYYEEADTVAKPFEAATAEAIKDYSKLAGTFHDGDSGILEGIVFPVLVDPDTDLDGLTVAESEEELFGLPEYSYYELDEIPACYKIIYQSEDDGYYFEWAEGPETEIDGEAELLTETKYGDFQLNLKDLDPALFGYESLDEVPACGVLIRTVDESGEYAYSLTHVQNVLSLSELAWSVGLTTEVDGAAIDAESYADLNGETINAVWFITREGRVKVNFEGIYVPIKLPADQASVKVANATTAAGTTTVTTVLPEGFEAEYSVEGLAGATVNETGTALTYSTAAAAGTYKLTVEDKTGVYAPLTAEFTLTTSGGGGGNGGGGGGGGGGGRTTPATPAPTPIVEPEVPLAETPGLNFVDVPANAWFADAVRFVVEKGLMNGISATEFGPEITTTRGMIVTILYRMAGSPAVSTAATFSDVKANMYYSNAVAWGSANGIVKGYTDNTFKPDQIITREELAAMLYRYVQFNGGGFTGAWYFPLTAKDADSISEYADEAIHWCVMNNLITGFEDNTIRPQGKATRAQVAAIIQRFVTLNETQAQPEVEEPETTENPEGEATPEGTEQTQPADEGQAAEGADATQTTEGTEA